MDKSIFPNAALMRDRLLKERSAKKITLKEITNKLSAINLPYWLQSEIILMCKYKEHDRITCPIEQAMEAAVHSHILKEIID